MEQLSETEENREVLHKGKYLTFLLNKEVYGIDIEHVTEIIGMQTITCLPELPPYMKGVINLRGKIIPVMDVRLRFYKDSKEYDHRTCIIVISILEISFGLIVDSVSEVVVILDQDIVQLPEINKVSNKFIKGIGKINHEVKLLLDCEKLLNHTDLEQLNNTMEELK